MFAASSATVCVTQGCVLRGRGVTRRGHSSSSKKAPTTTRSSRSLQINAQFSVSKLTSVLAKKTQGDLDRVFKGTSRTREKLSYMDEVLALWRLDDLEDTLDELEETLLSVDFGPATSGKVLDAIREKVEKGEIKTGREVKQGLKDAIVQILESANGGKAGAVPLNFNEKENEPSVVLVVGVNGGGKTTTVGKLSHRFAQESGAKVMLVPGDTFRAAAAEQLATWAERSNGVMAQVRPDGAFPNPNAYV